MYRTRSHVTVRDLAGWNEVVSVVEETNRECESRGLPTAELWTETIGPFNHLVVEVDYESLAAYETQTAELWKLPGALDRANRISAVAVDNGYLEMFERATPVEADPTPEQGS